jgi:imidazole glycerol phosphate synthase glutamine amidotransferase subunit
LYRNFFEFPTFCIFGQLIATHLRLEAQSMRLALQERIAAGLPTLLVCVGFQLLAESSAENPGVRGLGVVPVHVERFPEGVVVPQQGWNEIKAQPKASIVKSGTAYFSNSYCMRAQPLGWAGASTQHGVEFVSALERGAVVALQFHPELSGDYGLDLLKRWMAAKAPAAESTVKPVVTNLKRRIIPCLDVRDGRVVKGVKFQGLKEVGDPAEVAAAYYQQGADELTMLDVSATAEKRKTCCATIRAIKKEISLPLTVGGGIKTTDDCRALLEAGADKISINTAAVLRPSLIAEVARTFGSQCTVLAIDAVSSGEASWEVVIKSGKEKTGKDVVAWAVDAVAKGAGEILLTSFDRDGTRAGYDLGLLRAVSQAVSVPVIASGGADSAAHIAEAFEAGADAALAASIFHYKDTTVDSVKSALLDLAVPVRSSRPNVPNRTNRQCLVPSIDLLDGRTVQLVGGDPDALEVDAGDPVPLASRLGVAGEIAVVDLDAALNKGTNRELIKKLLPLAKCRVGGGIRTAEAALEWLNAGATKVVIGTAAKPDLLRQLPRERVVVALDARHGEVVVDGWQTKTGKSIKECMKELLPFAAGFLVTFVEREGQMTGVCFVCFLPLV